MAPQKGKKKAPTPGYCRWCCSCCCTGFSIWCIFFGLSWPAALDLKLQTAIYNGGIASKAEKDYTGVTESNRKHNNAGVFLKYHYYNITNPVAVMNGAAPAINKLGPYVFQKYVTEHNIEYIDGKKIRRGRKVGELQFMPGFSCGTCRLSDRIVGAENLLSMWFMGRKCVGDKGATGSGDAAEAFKHCSKIAKFGIFEPHTVQQLMWGYKEWDAIVLRANNGHHVCPTHLEPCQDAKVLAQYNGAGQYGSFLDGPRMFDKVQLSGYGNEGCQLPYEYKRHGIICPKGIALGNARRSWGIEKVAKRGGPQVDIGFKGVHGPAMSYEKHKDDVKAGTCSVWKDKAGKCTDDYDLWIKAITSNFIQFYDDTPFDTGDDKDLDTTFKNEDDAKPCKWDGSTNNIAGCPHMEQVKGFGLGHGIFHPDRMAKCPDKDGNCPTLPHFGIMEDRLVQLKYTGNDMVHGIKGKKYSIDEKYYAASPENAKYGMPKTGAPWDRFPGTGVIPKDKALGGMPLFVTHPHWLGGGNQMIKWHKEMGTRLPTTTSDGWSISYEPTTGLPIAGKLQWQFNSMYIPTLMKIHSGNTSTPVQYDFTNLTLEAGFFKGERVNLGAMGKYRNCATPNAAGGCPVFMPFWTLQLEINFTPMVLEKIKKLLGGLKTIGLLKTVMRFWMYGGICGIACVGSCLAYHYFGSTSKR